MAPRACSAAPAPTATDGSGQDRGRGHTGASAGHRGCPGPRRHVLVDRRHPGQGDRLVPEAVDDARPSGWPTTPAASPWSRSTARTTSRPRPSWPRRGSSARPTGFTMNIKAWSLLTGHPTFPDSLWPDLQPAVAARAPGQAPAVRQAPPARCRRGGVGPVPPLAHAAARAGQAGRGAAPVPAVVRAQGRRTARDRAGPSPGWPACGVCVEFRHARWLEGGECERTLEFLEELGVRSCASTSPPASRRRCRRWWRPPPTWPSSASTAATPATWEDAEIATAAERFRYRYTPDELREWVPRIRELAASARRGPRPHEQLLPGRRRGQRGPDGRPVAGAANVEDMPAPRTPACAVGAPIAGQQRLDLWFRRFGGCRPPTGCRWPSTTSAATARRSWWPTPPASAGPSLEPLAAASGPLSTAGRSTCGATGHGDARPGSTSGGPASPTTCWRWSTALGLEAALRVRPLGGRGGRASTPRPAARGLPGPVRATSRSCGPDPAAGGSRGRPGRGRAAAAGHLRLAGRGLGQLRGQAPVLRLRPAGPCEAYVDCAWPRRRGRVRAPEVPGRVGGGRLPPGPGPRRVLPLGEVHCPVVVARAGRDSALGRTWWTARSPPCPGDGWRTAPASATSALWRTPTPCGSGRGRLRCPTSLRLLAPEEGRSVPPQVPERPVRPGSTVGVVGPR